MTDSRVGGRPPRRGAGDESLYAAIRARALAISVESPEVESRLAPLIDILWDALSPCGVSWIGFYLHEEATGTVSDRVEAEGPVDGGMNSAEAPSDPSEGHLVLAARRDGPACSPIGLHGVCGQAFREECVRLVEDVALLGSGYVACDPRDRSEIVVPIYRNGVLWGVLDADSHEAACFGDADVAGLVGVLRTAGLLARDLPIRADRLRHEGHLL